jgi:hypothetical protein
MDSQTMHRRRWAILGVLIISLLAVVAMHVTSLISVAIALAGAAAMAIWMPGRAAAAGPGASRESAEAMLAGEER